MESPVQEDVRQRRVRSHVWHSLVDDHHNEGREAEDEDHVDGADDGLPVLGVQSPRLLLVFAVVVLMILIAAQRVQHGIAIPRRFTVTQPVHST